MGSRALTFRRLAVNLLFLASSCLIALGAAEAFIRLAGHTILGNGEWLSSSVIFDLYDEPVGFSLWPGSGRTLIAGGAYTVREQMNSFGLRDVERTYERTPGRRRVLILGDSFVYGQGARFEEILPRRLERMLPGVEVVNAGIPGYNLGQDYLSYKDRMRRFRPDLVIVALFINDFQEQGTLVLTRDEEGLPLSYRRRPDLVERDKRRIPTTVRSRLSEWMRQHSMLFALARQRLRTARAGGGEELLTENPRTSRREAYFPFFLAKPDLATAKGWSDGLRVLEALGKDVAADGGRFAVLLVPAVWQLSDPLFAGWGRSQGADLADLDRLKPQRTVTEWCRASATPCLDLVEAMTPRGLDLYYPYDMHWNGEGHRVAAEAVRDFLAANGLP